MNKQEFETIYKEFTQRRKDILQKLLQGEADISIAESMGIEATTIRKHIERTCQEFGLDDKNQLGRRSRRSELVALFANYKPELLSDRTFGNRDDHEVMATIGLQQGHVEEQRLLSKPLINKTAHFEEKFNMFFQECMFQNMSQYDLFKQLRECCSKIDGANLLNKKGLEYYEAMDLQQANFYLAWAIQFNPDFPEAHYNLALVYEAKDDLKQATHHYNQATKIPGKEKSRGAFAAINNLSRLLILEDNSQNQTVIEKIEPILSQVKDNKIKASLFKNLGWAYFQQENYQKARENLFKSLELDQNYAPAHCLLAKVLEAENNKEAALVAWNKFLESYSDETKSYKYLPELIAWKMDALRILRYNDA